MGFNKRYYNFDRINKVYSNAGLEALKRYFFVDGAIFEDEISHKIYSLFCKHKYTEAIKIIEDEQCR